jgi:hypothetical protein
MWVFRVVAQPSQEEPSSTHPVKSGVPRERPAPPTALQVELNATYLEKSWQMFVAVDSPLKREECIDLFTGKGRDKLDMKIGSNERVNTLYMGGMMGLRFTPQLTQPRALPASSRLTYFQLVPEAQPEEWKAVLKSKKLAVRINEKLVSAAKEGAETITITHGRQQVPVRLMLYATRALG